MKYTDQQRLQKIYDYSVKLLETIETLRITSDKLLSDVPSQWLVTTPLYNIGEHVSHLSADLKAAHSTVPWELISGLRHRLVHDYDGTNWNLIVKIIFRDIPILIDQIESFKEKKFER